MMNIAVIFAGGVGQRMRSKELPKQFLKLHNRPIIIHTLDVFENSPEIDAIVIACVADWIDYLKELIEKFHITKVKKIVPGGATGQDSIYNGLKAAESIKTNEDDIVLIHDGVRPLIRQKTLHDDIAMVEKHGTAITSVKVKETILVVDDDEKIIEVPDRSHSRLARAPQCFYLKDILAAHEKAREEGKHDFIDSCSMMKHYGYDLYLVDGPQENIKVTTPDDFYTMRALLDAREDAQIYGLD
nr:2-C-methyl-D-erythritol 4-phosphate cytidylyltransferase [uncultured Ligilactobacillus sp.]